MKLYTITTGGLTLAWAGTQADAKAAKRDQEAKRPGSPPITWQEFEVPTDKAGLLEFLNKHCIGATSTTAASGE